MIIRYAFSWLLCLFLMNGKAQVLNGVSTRWDDSFSEWSLYAEMDEETEQEGELKLRWQFPDDWSDWEYRLGEAFGRIRMKWKGNPNEWEVRGDNQIVTVRSLWNNDFREWRVEGDGVRITVFSRYGNVADYWSIREEQYGFFEMYSTFEGDPRDWVIVDELDASVSLPVKIGLVFAVLFSSTPKQ